MRRFVVHLALAITALPWAAEAQVYVDGSLASACASYDPSSRACGGGARQAYPSLSAGLAGAGADGVIVRAGTFREALVVGRDGTAAQPFFVRAQMGETVTITGVGAAALLVDGRSYVRIEGLTVEDNVGFARIVDSDHVVLRAIDFSVATAGGTTAGVKIIRSEHVRVEECSLARGTDNLTLIESRWTVIANNTFDTAGHSLLSVRCSSDTLVRGNRFSNPDQKAMEIYDCEASASDVPVRYDATHRNVIEENLFLLTRSSTRSHDYNAIQYAGQDGIVRRNFFYDNAGGGVGIQVYPDEATVNYGHRIYHNTFVDNRCFAIISSSVTGSDYRDNVVVANLLFGNRDCSGGGEQWSLGSASAVRTSGNMLADGEPGFMDLGGRDLRLTAASPALDAAPFLTRIRTSSTGTTWDVEDAAYFFDGGGIEGVAGDRVQLEGSTEIAVVVAVDRAARRITLDRAVAAEAGRGIGLAFVGSAPDFGADERGAPMDVDAGISDAGTGVDAGSAGSETGPMTDAGSGTLDGSSAQDAAGGSDPAACACRADGRSTMGLWPLLLALAPLCAYYRARRRQA